MPKNTELSIVIPAYNEVDNFQSGALDKVNQYVRNQAYGIEVIVVDDGSKDQTAELIQDWIEDKSNWTLIRSPHKGKAFAVKTGVMKAVGKYILFTDFDQATPLSEIEKLLPFIQKGYEIVIGSREVKGSKREKEPFYRHLMGRVWNLLVQSIAIPGIRDTQCGFKLFKGETAKELFKDLRVYRDGEESQAYTGAFDVELLYLAQKRKLQIAEVPVHWKHVSTTRVNPLRDSLRMFWDLVRIRLADLQGKYAKNEKN